jgi:hypothetical protein
VPPGDVELEVGYLYRRLAGHAPQHTTPFLFKLSLTKWLQLQVSSNGYTYSNLLPIGRYFDDVAVGAKLHMIDQHDFFPSLSWSFLLNIPMPAQEGYVRGYDALFTAYITEKIGKLEADLNIGMNLFELSRAITVQPWVALALSYELPRDFIVMLENYYYADASPIAVHDGGTLFAVSYAPRSWIVIDVGADAGWFQKDRSVSAFVGCTLIVGNLWAPRKKR